MRLESMSPPCISRFSGYLVVFLSARMSLAIGPHGGWEETVHGKMLEHLVIEPVARDQIGHLNNVLSDHTAMGVG